MNTFKLFLDIEPAANGVVCIYGAPPTSSSTNTQERVARLTNFRSHLREFFLRSLNSISELKVASAPSKYLQSIRLYTHEDGSSVELVEDEWFGPMIESKNKDLIIKIFEILDRSLEKPEADN